jgi:D-sedoheptulose 7-phosphate isomerase
MKTALIEKSLVEHQITIKLVQEKLLPVINQSAERLCDVLNAGNKILVCGNGGSAADAQHFAAELVGRFELERGGLPAIALTTDTSILTAVGNDYGFSQLFSRQVEALAGPGDALIGISTSGNSENVILAMQKASERGCLAIGLTGRDGGAIAKVADLLLNVAVERTARVQEAHLMILHLICEQIDATVTNIITGSPT